MRCENCQTREATVHLTSMVSGELDSTTHQDFCDECATRMKHLPGVAEAGQLETSNCTYCQASAMYGAPDILAMMRGESRWRYLCQRCSEEDRRWLCEHAPGVTTGLPSVEEMQHFDRTLAELDAHLKRWAKEQE